MKTLELLKLSDAERWRYVQDQVAALETEQARLHLQAGQLPADDQSVRRLVFGRHLLLTLRLWEHSV